MERENFKTLLGFLLATIGGAVGIANLIAFPPLLHAHGILFAVFYLLFTIVIGIPVMTAEIAIGRFTSSNPVNAYQHLGGRKWAALGVLNLIGCFIALSIFVMLFAWTARYFAGYVFANVPHGSSANGAPEFANYLNTGWREVALVSALMVGVNVIVIGLGIQKGIERVSKFLLPVFAAVLLLFAAKNFFAFAAVSNSTSALMHLPQNWGEMLSAALGQAFFSLSLGAGAMLTYGSYLSKRDHIGRLSNTIVHTDTIVAFVCSLFILPLSLDYRFANTPLFIFVTLSDYFGSMASARLVGGVFFLCLSFVVLTMTLSVMEPVVSYWIDQYKRKRHVAAIFTGVAIALCCLPFILSFGASAELTNFIQLNPNGEFKSFFDVVFDVFINVALPLGGLFTCFFVSKVWGIDNFLKAVRGADSSGSHDWFATSIAFCLRTLTPALILILLTIKICQAGSIYFSR